MESCCSGSASSGDGSYDETREKTRKQSEAMCIENAHHTHRPNPGASAASPPSWDPAQQRRRPETRDVRATPAQQRRRPGTRAARTTPELWVRISLFKAQKSEKVKMFALQHLPCMCHVRKPKELLYKFARLSFLAGFELPVTPK